MQMVDSTESMVLIADILGHPQSAPTVEELVYMNPSLDEADIRSRLAYLRHEYVVARGHMDVGDSVDDDGVVAYFRLTDGAMGLAKTLDVIPIDAWQRQYQRVEKPERIRELEELPRSDDG